jgi:hypothetical protein
MVRSDQSIRRMDAGAMSTVRGSSSFFATLIRQFGEMA